VCPARGSRNYLPLHRLNSPPLSKNLHPVMNGSMNSSSMAFAIFAVFATNLFTPLQVSRLNRFLLDVSGGFLGLGLTAKMRLALPGRKPWGVHSVLRWPFGAVATTCCVICSRPHSPGYRSIGECACRWAHLEDESSRTKARPIASRSSQLTEGPAANTQLRTGR